MTSQYYEGVGRRKTSTARVRVTAGTGLIVVNGKEGAAYFPRQGDLELATAPLRAVGMESKLDLSITVSGGGLTGPSGAPPRGPGAGGGPSRSIGRRPARPGAGAIGDGSGDAAGAPLGQVLHPRRPSQGAQEARPQARAQGP